MTTSLTIHEHGTMFTVRINGTAMGSAITASISGPILYALVDGLLWWGINRKLDALVACAMGQPAPTQRDQALAFGSARAEGEEMVMHCFTSPFHEQDEERQLRITTYLTRHLPNLHPIADHGPHSPTARTELAELHELVQLLSQRIIHSGQAMHGIEGMTTTELQAA